VVEHAYINLKSNERSIEHAEALSNGNAFRGLKRNLLSRADLQTLYSVTSLNSLFYTILLQGVS
jgi:hypothetical protein